MQQLAGPQPFLTLDLPDEAATRRFAEDVAICLRKGDTIALKGGLGVGKTTFARAALRALAGDPGLEVPSPTFTLVQTYATDRLNVSHFDLYRVSRPDEVLEIGLSDAADGAVLVEWPENAGEHLPAEAVTIALAIAGSGRRAAVSGSGDLARRIARTMAERAFLDAAGWQQAQRAHLKGDASTRRFERITDGARRAVLMDWPPGSQLPKNDPRAPFRAEGARTFVAVDDALRATNLSAPEIYAADTEAGFVLMEDFGDGSIALGGAPDPERYGVVVDMLAFLHATPRPAAVPMPGGGTHRFPHLAGAAIIAELGNFTERYVPYATGKPIAPDAHADLLAIWKALGEELAASEQSWVLFDLQAPNLFWLPEREGVARIGLIDFQDMFIGASAYDVASICQDARIAIPADLEQSLRDRYVTRRLEAGSPVDAAAFETAYAISSALRIVKIMGAFARYAADGNASYIRYLQGLREYLARSLAHPVLSPFALWYERHLSAASRAAE